MTPYQYSFYHNNVFNCIIYSFKINEHDTDTSMDFMYFKFIN